MRSKWRVYYVCCYHLKCRAVTMAMAMAMAMAVAVAVDITVYGYNCIQLYVLYKKKYNFQITIILVESI